MAYGSAPNDNGMVLNSAGATGATGAAPGYTDDDIKKMYDDMLGRQKAAGAAQTQAGVSQYEQQKQKIPKAYDPLRDEAYLNDQTAMRQQRERLANMGLSGTGGKSMTLESNRQAGLQNTLGDISRQQQSALDEIDNQIANLKAQGNFTEAQMVADNAKQMYDALMNNYQSNRSFAEQQRQYNESQGLQKQQLDLQMQSDKFNQAWALYQSGKMSAKNFEKITGIPVDVVKSKKGKKKTVEDPSYWYDNPANNSQIMGYMG